MQRELETLRRQLRSAGATLDGYKLASRTERAMGMGGMGMAGGGSPPLDGHNNRYGGLLMGDDVAGEDDLRGSRGSYSSWD